MKVVLTVVTDQGQDNIYFDGWPSVVDNGGGFTKVSGVSLKRDSVQYISPSKTPFFNLVKLTDRDTILMIAESKGVPAANDAAREWELEDLLEELEEELKDVEVRHKMNRIRR